MKPEQLAKGETWRCPQAQGRCLIVECSTLQQGRTARILRFFFCISGLNICGFNYSQTNLEGSWHVSCCNFTEHNFQRLLCTNALIRKMIKWYKIKIEAWTWLILVTRLGVGCGQQEAALRRCPTDRSPSFHQPLHSALFCTCLVCTLTLCVVI